MEARELRDERYTYGQYLAMELDDRYELVDGALIKRSRLSIAHQRVSRKLISQLDRILDGKRCEAFPEIDVALMDEGGQNENDVYTVFVPDIAVVCDKGKLRDGCYIGAPTVIFEILSKSTAGMDKVVKYDRYARAGVREYWLVSVEEESATVYLNHQGVYTPKVLYPFDSTEAEVLSLENCILDLSVLLQS